MAFIADSSVNGKIDFGVQTHYAHGTNVSQYDTVEDYGSNVVRDGLSWALIEQNKGEYDFSHRKVSYIDDLTQQGANPIITFQARGNPNYNNKKNVFSDKDIKAFADYVVATLDHFDGIKRIEIGNEINGGNSQFISGKAKGSDLNERAEYYTKLLKTVYSTVKAAHPDVEVIGGATLEIPVGYMEFLRDHGALEYMDGFSFHPYRTTEAEGVGDQIRYMKHVLGDMPLYATEFGKQYGPDGVDKVPGHMLKMISMMGDAGVEEAIWYQFRDDDSKSRALHSLSGEKRPAANAFEFINEVLLPEGNPVRLETNLPLYLFKFGDEHFVLWGKDQEVSFSGDGLTFFNSSGEIIDEVSQVTDDPIIVSGKNVNLQLVGPEIASDAYYNFNLFNDPDLSSWTYFSKLDNGDFLKASIQGGQQQPNRGYTPYVTGEDDNWGKYRIDHNKIVVDSAYSVVERFTANSNGVYNISSSWDVHKSSNDGVTIAILVNGHEVVQRTVTGKKNINIKDLQLLTGDEVDFIVSARGNDIKDIVYRDITLTKSLSDGGTTILTFDDLENRFPDDSVPQDITDETSSAVESSPTDADSDANDASKDEETGSQSLEIQAALAVVTDLTTLAFATSGGIRGNKNDNILLGNGSSEYIRSGAGNDVIEGRGGVDHLQGLGDDDTLYGGSGRDKLDGGAGADKLDGGSGSDFLIGGSGGDVFEFKKSGADSVDYVADYRAHEGDVVDISDLTTGYDSAVDDINDFVSLTKSGSLTVLSVNEDGVNNDFRAIVVIQDFGSQSLQSLELNGSLIA